MQKIAKDKISAINETVPLTKTTIGREKSDVSIRKIWVLYYISIRSIISDAKKPSIS